MSASLQRQLITYLKDELSIPDKSISLALRQQTDSSSHLHIILWQYGLVTLEQLSKIYDWLERTTPILTP